MPKRISNPKRTRDVNQTAHQLVAMSTAEPMIPLDEIESVSSPEEISRIMAEMGRKGGQIGGKRRLLTMTPTQRKKIAKKAAAARWANQKDK